MIDQAAGVTRVLLIGRDPIVLWGLEKLIDSQKPRVEVVGKFTHCAEAFSQLEKLSADVSLLDWDLGIKNAVDDISRLTGLSKAKIMILTGSRDPSAHVSARVAALKNNAFVKGRFFRIASPDPLCCCTAAHNSQ